MSKIIKVQENRDRAAQALRESRQKDRPDLERKLDLRLAKTYKDLADGHTYLAKQDEGAKQNQAAKSKDGIVPLEKLNASNDG